MLDGMEDPHNLGAIIRTCDAIGVDGVIIGKKRSVGLNATVAKVSTGAIDHVPVAQVTNLSRTLDSLKKEGFWVVGCELDNSTDYRLCRLQYATSSCDWIRRIWYFSFSKKNIVI